MPAVCVRLRLVGAHDLCLAAELQKGYLQPPSIANGLAENVIMMIGLCEDPHEIRERQQYGHLLGIHTTLEI
jgi:hypothetical protein